VARYAGDIPPGAMRATLQKSGLLQETDGALSVTQQFFYSRTVDEDFIRGLGFALSNLGSTLAHNAALHQRQDLSRERKGELGRLERGVWSEHLTKEGIAKFKAWVDSAAQRFLEEANRIIGENELPQNQWASVPSRPVGIRVFYYEED
jgi:hypothetical protein